MVQWPDLTLPPINLWNVPWQQIRHRNAQTRPPARPKGHVEQRVKMDAMQRLLRTR